MSYRIETASRIVDVQALLDVHSSWELVGYSIAKNGTHCLIFKR